MIEQNISTCKNCRKLKQKIQRGAYNNGIKRYVDEQGKLWNGNNCPACHKEIQKQGIKERRAKAKLDNSSVS